MHITLHGSRRATQRVCVRASFHLHVIHDVCLSVRCLSLCVCPSPVSLRCLPLLFHTLLVLFPALRLQCRQRRGIKPLRLRTMRSIAPWRYTILSQVMSPTSSTTSTTQRLLGWSSRMNRATYRRSLRTRVMPKSTVRPSEKRYLHHCTFRSEKNQRTGDKLITLMKKVCCQLSPFSHTLVRGDPYANQKDCWDLPSYRRAAKKGRHAFGTHMVYRETFLQIHMHLHQLLILKNWISGVRQLRSRFICLQRRKVKDQNKIEIWDASLDRQPKIQSSSVEETLQRLMEQTNNDCRFRIFISTNSLHQLRLLAGR